MCYSLVAEIPSTRLKIKTVVLARNFYNFGGIINYILMPKMLLSTEWNWGAFTGFFWAGVNALLIVWCFFRLPEPKGAFHCRRSRPISFRLTCVQVVPMPNSTFSSRTGLARGNSPRPRSTSLPVHIPRLLETGLPLPRRLGSSTTILSTKCRFGRLGCN